MKKKTYFVLLVGLLSFSLAQANQESVLQRKTLAPRDAAKIKSVESRQWIRKGIRQNIDDTVRSKSYGGGNTCVTNVASPQQESNKDKHTSAGKSSTVVVTGDVINVCK